MDKELEKIIRDTLKEDPTPSRDSFRRMLSTLDTSVTESSQIRYNTRTTSSDIISNKIADVIHIWKSKKLVLIPSLVLLVLIGAFSLSPRAAKYDTGIAGLMPLDETIEEGGVDYDDQTILTTFDEPSIDELSTIQNEL